MLTSLLKSAGSIWYSVLGPQPGPLSPGWNHTGTPGRVGVQHVARYELYLAWKDAVPCEDAHEILDSNHTLDPMCHWTRIEFGSKITSCITKTLHPMIRLWANSFLGQKWALAFSKF
mmetsp:Transcript_101094/g.174636  ORF Transcript_101094/g.174636 Transcript_101094/m.174636 type:complete len:117 (-) Transcript_101094:481-831(-)